MDDELVVEKVYFSVPWYEHHEGHTAVVCDVEDTAEARTIVRNLIEETCAHAQERQILVVDLPRSMVRMFARARLGP